MFLAKLSTVSIILVIITGSLIFIVMRAKGDNEHLVIKNINEKYDTMSLMLNQQVLNKKEFKKYIKEHKKELKEKESSEDRKKLFVLNFVGDIRASTVSSLREEITAILTIAEKKDEVLVILESGGGTVHGYGLGASQLKRIKDKDIKLTAAVDKVAASGGYMMACVADKIIAAPFAIIGSIGVLAQIPNFHRLLKKMDIDFEQITAGDHKRTLTLFGENTDKDREKFKEELEDTHKLFKEFVKDSREQVDIDKIATGEHWFGKRAIELNLVDELITSDDYLTNAAKEADVFEVKYERKKPVSEKLFSLGANLLDSIDGRG
ncbi:MAG: protease SohB [Proteobacteria bacterium]|nr:protease SohB [Pseudomonadota bacterium]NOG60782.1 protease SohB [Pseudomonadota bacterium]